VNGHDELTQLGTAINDLLLRLHDTYNLERTNSTLEQQVTARTKALDDQLDQMKRTNSLMVDRELRMRALKEEIADLKAKLAET
jgi:predicted RNase H-like nuclease (RuvC/YqgF family)